MVGAPLADALVQQKERAMDSHPLFRLANQADIETLMEYIRQFYAIDNYDFEESVARPVLEKIVHDPSLGRVWMIYLGEEAIGYIVITFGYSLEYGGRDAFIDELYIEDSYRNQGLGAKAMEFVLGACPGLDIHALHLEVEHTNIAGQKLYRKFDFEGHNRYLLTRKIP